MVGVGGDEAAAAGAHLRGRLIDRFGHCQGELRIGGAGQAAPLASVEAAWEE